MKQPVREIQTSGLRVEQGLRAMQELRTFCDSLGSAGFATASQAFRAVAANWADEHAGDFVEQVLHTAPCCCCKARDSCGLQGSSVSEI